MRIVYAEVNDGPLSAEPPAGKATRWEFHSSVHCGTANVGIRTGLADVVETFRPLPALFLDLIDRSPATRRDPGTQDPCREAVGFLVCGCVADARNGRSGA